MPWTLRILKHVKTQVTFIIFRTPIMELICLSYFRIVYTRISIKCLEYTICVSITQCDQCRTTHFQYFIWLGRITKNIQCLYQLDSACQPPSCHNLDCWRRCGRSLPGLSIGGQGWGVPCWGWSRSGGRPHPLFLTGAWFRSLLSVRILWGCFSCTFWRSWWSRPFSETSFCDACLFHFFQSFILVFAKLAIEAVRCNATKTFATSSFDDFNGFLISTSFSSSVSSFVIGMVSTSVLSTFVRGTISLNSSFHLASIHCSLLLL